MHGGGHAQGIGAAVDRCGGLLAVRCKVGVFQLIRRTGLLPFAALLVVERHAVAVSVIDRLPAGSQRLVAGGSQRDVGRLVGEKGVFVVIRVGVGCFGVHRDPRIFVLRDLAVTVEIADDLFDQNCREVVVARGREPTFGGSDDEERRFFIHAQIVVLAGQIGLGVVVVADRVGLALARILNGLEIVKQRGRQAGGSQFVLKVAVRFHGECLNAGSAHVGGDEQARALFVIHDLHAVRVLPVDEVAVIVGLGLDQFHGLRLTLRRDAEVFTQVCDRCVALGEEHQDQLVGARIGFRGGDLLSVTPVFILGVQRRGGLFHSGDFKQAGLHHGDADLLAGLVVTEHTERYRRDLRRGAAAADVPVVLADLIVKAPALVDVLPQVEGAADVIRQDVEHTPVRFPEVAGMCQTAVDAEIIPRRLGGFGDAGASCNIHGRLAAEDELHVRRRERLTGDPAEAELADPLRDLDPCRDVAAAVELEVDLVLGRIETAEHAGFHFRVDAKDLVVIRQLHVQPHAAARAHAGVFDVIIGAFLTRQTQIHLEFVDHVEIGDRDVRTGVFQIARADRDVCAALEHLDVIARRRELETDGRYGDIVAVDGVGQPVKAAAAAAQERRGYGRRDGDARLHRQEEVELIRRKAAVVQPLELQISFRFKEVKSVDLQREIVGLFAVKRVDVRVDLEQVKTHELAAVDLTAGFDTVLLEFDRVVRLFIRPVAKAFQIDDRIVTVENQIKPHLPGEDDIAVRLELRLVNEAADLRDVDKHEHSVVRRIHAERQHPILHRELSGGRIQLLAPIELEARRGVLHHGGGVKAREHPVLIHADVEVVACRPGGGDGGRQGELIVGEFVILALLIGLLLKIAAQGTERIAVERLELSGDHIVDQRGDDHAAVRLVKAQLAGVLRDGDLVRRGELGILYLSLILAVHIAEAPDVDRPQIEIFTDTDRSAAGLGGQAVRLRVVAHKSRGV